MSVLLGKMKTYKDDLIAAVNQIKTNVTLIIFVKARHLRME